MTWGYLPPAVSDVFLASVVGGWLGGKRTTLESEICAAVGCGAAAAGSSWVLVLRQLLEELAAAQPARREIVLPSYSCNEFTKATLLAGLRPRYVDLTSDLTSDVATLGGVIGPNTLAVFSINNIGRESDNAGVRELCDRRGVVCIEDATYTFLGVSDRDGRKFGTYGHYAVLNFSEGKIIPVGGGAVLTNIDAGTDVIGRVRARIAVQPPQSPLRELVSLFVYRAGSSRAGYSAYRWLRELSGADLKKRLSMEPTRADEVGNDLERDAQGNVALRSERATTLANQAELRPLSIVKQLCGICVVRNAARLRSQRQARYAALQRALEHVPGVQLFRLPADGMPIKAPFLILGEVTPEQLRQLDKIGVARGYATEYPTYGDSAYPSSNRFFERMFTLPVHRYVSDSVIREIATAVSAVTAPPHSAATSTHLRVVSEAE
jgi:perosamine synthetase